jgi:Spy/CpxP family protein refolding chaperone
MHRTSWKIASLVLITALALLGRAKAQQAPQQHHPEGTQASQEQMGESTPDAPAQVPMGQPMQGMMQQMQGMMQQMQGMMQQMHSQMGRGGMMRSGGMMGDRDDDESSDDDDMMGRGMMRGRRGMMGHMQRQMAKLTERLNLSDEQQLKVQALLRTYAKEGIRLKADIATAHIDLQQLLDTQPIDMDGVKSALQTMAGKEAELRLGHIAAMQDIQKLLTPEQQKQFSTLWGPMSGGGMMGHGGIMGRGSMMGRGGMMGPGGMQRGKPGN